VYLFDNRKPRKGTVRYLVFIGISKIYKDYSTRGEGGYKVGIEKVGRFDYAMERVPCVGVDLEG
jgi:hypothetical protein